VIEALYGENERQQLIRTRECYVSVKSAAIKTDEVSKSFYNTRRKQTPMQPDSDKRADDLSRRHYTGNRSAIENFASDPCDVVLTLDMLTWGPELADDWPRCFSQAQQIRHAKMFNNECSKKHRDNASNFYTELHSTDDTGEGELNHGSCG